MKNNSSATAILGLEGMALLSVSERDGELEYAVETTAAADWCPVCGAQARLHDRRPTRVSDCRPVTLVGQTRLALYASRVRSADLQRTHPGIAPRASGTERARTQACRRVGRDGNSVAAVARDFGVGWATVMAALREYAARLPRMMQRAAGPAGRLCHRDRG